LEYDGPIKDYCGTCTKCIDACPTDALATPYSIDASKCISYLTIELKDQMPEEFTGKMDNWIFGCDVCQDVCPWNSFSRPHKEEQLMPNPLLNNFKKENWEEMTKEVFDTLFKNSAIKRTRFEGLKRNIDFIKK
jgi:epoxyqueuosine reductase